MAVWIRRKGVLESDGGRWKDGREGEMEKNRRGRER